MKNILISISFLFSFFISFSQPIVNRTTGANTVNDPRFSASKNFYLPRYIDTIQANLVSNIGIDSCSAIIYTYSDNNVWKRSCSPKRWELIGGSVGSSLLFGRTDTRNNTGNNMYFSAADQSLHIDSLFNFNVTTISGSMNLLSAGGITLQSGNTSALTINTNDAIYMDGNWGFKTTPTRTVSIGDDIGGVNTLSLYAPNGSVAFVQSASGAGLAIAGGNSIYLQPSSYTSDGQMVIAPTATVGYIAQQFKTGGGGLLGEIGLGAYGGDDENEFYFKSFNVYDPIEMDSNQTYINLYHKIKLTNIPNENDLMKIIGIDDSNNVRYIDASILAGGLNIYNTDGVLTAPRLLTGDNGANSLTLDSLATFSVSSYDGSHYSNISVYPTLLQFLYHGTTTDANIAILDGVVSISSGIHEIGVSEDSVRIRTVGFSNDTTNRKIVSINPITGALSYSNWISGGGSGGSGTVTDFIFTDANGFDGTVSTSTSTPTLSLISTVADTRVLHSTSGALTGSGQFTFTGQALQLASTNTTQTTTSSALAQTYNSLTTGTGQYMASSSLSSGRLMDLVVTGTAGLTNQTGLHISLSGANATGAQTTYGLDVSNTHTGTSTNVAARFVASGGSNNTSAIFTGRIASGGVTTPFHDIDNGAGTFATGSILVSTAAGTAANGNFSTSATTLVGTNTGSIYQYDGSTNSDGRVYIGGTGATQIGIGRPYSTLIVGAATVPEASSGNHPFIGSAIFIPPSITIGAATVTDAATVRITGPTTATVSGTNSALLINSGNLRMDNGSISLNTAGNKLNIATGSNASVGLSAAMTAGSITISTTAVTSSSNIMLTPVGTGSGSISLGTVIAGTSFVINSSDGADVRQVQWWVIN